jgi:hypothetical protein
VARFRRFSRAVDFCSQYVLGEARLLHPLLHLSFAFPESMATSPLLQGTMPSEYRFIRRLGKKANQQGLQRFYGACSAVYLCEMRGQPFVLKMMLNVYDVGTVDLEKEFQNEFSILRAFQQDAQRSPHVIEMLYTVSAPFRPACRTLRWT